MLVTVNLYPSRRKHDPNYPKFKISTRQLCGGALWKY